jgi:lipopolysaccharide transport system ATP-binding protein
MGRLLQGQTAGLAEENETIWALKDVSFEVKRGEVVGIIGRNGAGKSTLLKILTRITEPTEGQAEIDGRVGSLLEVGTGFHAELTGRENIYLNGAILGMRKAEIDLKFDTIVAFSEMEKFLDTPVKHYSSGMAMRLAFAVAAHLDPEVLLVDEVLAVGDASFQRKCLQKVEDVGQQGRTVLFVSHNMPAISRICERVILLDGGHVVQDGPSHQVIGAYLHSGLGTTAAREWHDAAQAPGNHVVRLRAVRVRTEDDRISDTVDIRKPVRTEMEYEVLKPGCVLVPALKFFNEEGIHLFTTLDLNPAWRQRPRPTGRYISTAVIPGNYLAEGSIFVSPVINSFSPNIVHAHEHHAIAFQVIDTLDGDSARGDFAGTMKGVIRPLLQWETRTCHTIEANT